MPGHALTLTSIGICLVAATSVGAQNPATRRPDSVITAARAPRVTYVPKVSRADTLRGSYKTPGRRWWDASFYDLHVAISPNDSSIRGYNGITYRVLEPPPAKEMQIDLMEPLQVDSMIQDGKRVKFRREGAAFFASMASAQRAGETKTIIVYYHGRPQVAKNPPWQGGFTWGADSLGRPWVVT